MKAPTDLGSMMEFAAKLGDVLPLEILPHDDKDQLARAMHVRRHKAGEVVYHRGDPPGGANVVYAGLVKVMLLDEEGREALVALHGRGEFFGELALFTDAPREATVIAIMPTTVLQMTRDACWAVLDRNPKAREWMFKHLTETIERLSARYEAIVFLDVPGRVTKYLLELDADGAEPPITQDDLAAAVGSTRVTVNKILADLERRGLVRVERRHVAILDRPKLELEARR